MIKLVVLFGCELWAVKEEIKFSRNVYSQKLLWNVRGSIRGQMAAYFEVMFKDRLW